MPMNSSFTDEIAEAVAARVLKTIRNGEAPIVPEFLTAAQVAQLTGFSLKALENYRAKRTGCDF